MAFVHKCQLLLPSFSLPLHRRSRKNLSVIVMAPPAMTFFCPSAELIAHNDDLITQILLRLPIVSLLRFKSVSKTWLSLISNPQFCNDHALQNPNALLSGLFLRKSLTQLHFLSFDSPRRRISPPDAFISDPSGIKILQCCNGLILCSSLHELGATRRYYVCNPTTKQFVMLPPHWGCSAFPYSALGLCLVFDPRRSCHYKVVCVRSMYNSFYYHQIELYCSEVGEWRVCGSPFSAPYDMMFDNGVYWNGMVYWISPTRNTLCFDVDAECTSKMPNWPYKRCWGPARRSSYFGVSNGRLQAIEVHGPRCLQFDVFEMDGDGSEWFVKYEVDLQGIVAKFPEVVRRNLDPYDPNYHSFAIVGVVEEENDEESTLLLHVPGKIVAYNLKNRGFDEVNVFESNGNKSSLQLGWMDAYYYIETLACI